MSYRGVPVAPLLAGLSIPPDIVIEAVALDGFVAQIPLDLMRNTDAEDGRFPTELHQRPRDRPDQRLSQALGWPKGGRKSKSITEKRDLSRVPLAHQSFGFRRVVAPVVLPRFLAWRDIGLRHFELARDADLLERRGEIGIE